MLIIANTHDEGAFCVEGIYFFVEGKAGEFFFTHNLALHSLKLGK